MAKGGKLTKLKSVLKKMQSFKLGRVNSSTIVATHHHSSSDDDDNNSFSDKNLYPVYVGKSRRRYLVNSEVVDHPLFRELVERSGESEEYITVGCEVVLFEHLLWMLENADPQPESLDELVEFYSC
ncbi:auxin-responsive protein SAUR78-like [Lycium barbarum]|uniref:auxin-responsive protein SAUR78-like n=1 Tax=Lycium ferocissimum TaxID=112874 RepID=UPI0028160C0E|nr:auxin-responsive protein SAUR78-like [Lycium ferocissimum]XP_060189480.1 auxin-responsive protein SAUR78-like [Lycium barbarum]